MIDSKPRRPSTAMRSERQQGVFTTIIKERGYAFARGEMSGTYYVHASRLLNCELDQIEPGTPCTFEPRKTEKGPAAYDVIALI